MMFQKQLGCMATAGRRQDTSAVVTLSVLQADAVLADRVHVASSCYHAAVVLGAGPSAKITPPASVGGGQ
jgi:hypothetical protein